MAHSLRQLFLAASRQYQQVQRGISTSAILSIERGLNKVQLMGRVGNVPKEFTNSTSGKKLVAFPLVTSNSFKVKNPDGTETLTSKATWHSINVFNINLQGVVLKYVHKGTRLYVNGKIHNTKYTKEDGTEKYISVVIAEDVIMLSRQEGDKGQNENQEFAEESKQDKISIDEDSHNFL